MGAVANWARSDGAREIYLHVASGVPRARAFYLKNGFTLTGENFTMERDPRITMYTMSKSIGDEFQVVQWPHGTFTNCVDVCFERTTLRNRSMNRATRSLLRRTLPDSWTVESS